VPNQANPNLRGFIGESPLHAITMRNYIASMQVSFFVQIVVSDVEFVCILAIIAGSSAVHDEHDECCRHNVCSDDLHM
jgi:hypothetical protein